MSGLNRQNPGAYYLARYQQARDRLDKAVADLARMEGERDALMLSYDGVLLQLLVNAPPCWDGDQSEESIALEYVRRLEAATAEGNIAMEDSRHRYECDGRCQL